MTLYDQLITAGNLLFKYRGQIPIILFIICVPIISETSYQGILNYNYEVLIKYCAVIIGLLGVLFRYYIVGSTPYQTSGRNRNQQIADQLNQTGAYSIVRNPLYLANYMIWIGVSIYSCSYILCIITTLCFIIYYERIIMTEEKFLLKKFKKDYLVFCQNTPVFIPNFRNYTRSKYKFSIKKVLRQEYSSTLSAIIAFIYMDILTYWLLYDKQQYENINWSPYLYLISISLVATIFLKIIKKNSEFLNE